LGKLLNSLVDFRCRHRVKLRQNNREAEPLPISYYPKPAILPGQKNNAGFNEILICLALYLLNYLASNPEIWI